MSGGDPFDKLVPEILKALGERILTAVGEAAKVRLARLGSNELWCVSMCLRALADETLVDRRDIERVRAGALPVEWLGRQSTGHGERVAHPDEVSVGAPQAVLVRNVAGWQVPKPVDIGAVRIRHVEVETVTIGAPEGPGDGRGPVGTAREEECRGDRDAARKPRPSHSGAPFGANGSRSASFALGNRQETSG